MDNKEAGMKKKQLISIIIAGAVIVAVGVTGIVSNVISKKILGDVTTKDYAKDFFEWDNSTVVSDIPENDFIGVINIVGEIGTSGSDGYNHDLYMDYIDKMMESDNNRGIMLYVDSPGGSVYEADELYLKLMEYKETTNRPIWAYFASQACSGGYYISMAADKICANRNTWTGSIGVIVSLANYKELYDKLGIKEIDITSGKNKAMGSGGLDLTKEQQEILQSLVDEAYDQFVEIVADGRQMDELKVREIADGRIYSAKQALDIDMIDEIGSWEDQKEEFVQENGWENDIEFYAPKSSSSWLSGLFEKIENAVPKSETDLVEDIVTNKGNGVLKYYAK